MSEDRYIKSLEDLKAKSQLRELRNISGRNGVYLDWKEKGYINMSSNDYLGLAFDKQLITEFYSQINDSNILDSYGPGGASSRLLTGNSSLYGIIEDKLAKIYNKEAALFFNSGYHANIGILPALTSRNDLILSDKLNHASIIDGIRLCEAKYIRYRHNDYEHLEHLIQKHQSESDKIFIVTESVFSMDGDVADLKKLIELKKTYNCFIYLDEAHAVAARGKNGLGVCEELDIVDDIDFIVGTCGKAYASQGAFLVCSKVIKDYLVNTMRSLIFTTGLPPVTLAWINFVIDKLPSFNQRREHLKLLSVYLKKEIEYLGYFSESGSNIIPIVVCENSKSILLSECLQKHGFLVFPVRPPTVPEGTARLRISLSAGMTLEMLSEFVSVLKKEKI